MTGWGRSLRTSAAILDHSRTKTKSPQNNGICEHSHKTCSKFYRVAFRKKVYRSLDELQADLDRWIIEYNEARPHEGRWCFGKTPMQTFLNAMPMTKGKISQPDPSDIKPDRSTRHQLSDRVPANTFKLGRAFEQRRLPRSAPATDIPSPSAELGRERSLHQTIVCPADYQNAKQLAQSFAPTHSRRSACIN
jgi:Integrase core domain